MFHSRCGAIFIGSAPRVRGTPDPDLRPLYRLRFSPARAGNSDAALLLLRRLPVQPRACGELSEAAIVLDAHRGSAPRVRGTPTVTTEFGQCGRFSPARAGNSRAALFEGASLAVQPRACGELISMAPPRPLNTGSAPRVRGTPPAIQPTRVVSRFSPARALEIVEDGSAPRVRGTLTSAGTPLFSWRFSPARAGNTLPHGSR